MISAGPVWPRSMDVESLRVPVVLVTSALSLTFLNFGTSNPAWLIRLLDVGGAPAWAETARVMFEGSDSAPLNRLLFWGTSQILGYTVPPLLAIRFLLRDRVVDYGLSTKGLASHSAWYVGLLAVSIPFVIAASFHAEFQLRYPFYELAPGESLWPTMALWWVVYGLQFCALEFFFRGFMLAGLRRHFGYLAIFVMVVPYNMLHYDKPAVEALAAIAGGLVLGYLAYRTRSIWLGVGVHIGVAATMDVSALVQKGLI